MDPIIKRRMTVDVTVHPCTGIVDGDKTFGQPFVVKGYVQSRTGVITTEEGYLAKIETVIYVDGFYFGKIHKKDEVDCIYTGRCPVMAIAPYQGIQTDVEIIEVLL